MEEPAPGTPVGDTTIGLAGVEAGEPTQSRPDSEFPLDALFSGPAVEVAPTIGRFSILHALGEGGMGVVYLGYDARLDRRAAVKLLRSARASELARARMLREAQALARLSHPNVIAVYESGEYGDDDIYIAMEYVEGATLRRWLEQSSRTMAEILEVFIAAGRGLLAAHEHDLIHRDFKPDNVMVGTDGRVRVMDFGLARARGEAEQPLPMLPASSSESSESSKSGSLDDDLTATGALLGTPAYMAPEQYSGADVGAHSDQFSFCVSLWEALYGQRPFAGTTTGALAQAITSGERTPPPADTKVPARIRQALERGLATDPQQRWPSLGALLSVLEAERGRGRRWRWLGVASAAVAVVAGLGGMAWQQSNALREAEHNQRELAARRQALRSTALLAEGRSVDALRLAIEAAATFDEVDAEGHFTRIPSEVGEALHQASAAELSWGEVARVPGFASALALSPTGSQLALAHQRSFAGLDHDWIDIHALDGAATTLELPADCSIDQLSYANDGALLYGRCYESADLQVWDAHDGRALVSFAGDALPTVSTGDVIASRDGHEIQLTDARSGESRGRLRGHTLAPAVLQFSADGAWLASGGPDQPTHIWDVRAGVRVSSIDSPSMIAPAFFGDGSGRVAVVGPELSVGIFSVATGERLAVLAPPRPADAAPAEQFHALEVSPQGSRVALYVERMLWMWNSETGELLTEVDDQTDTFLERPFALHIGGARLSFSSDGARMTAVRHDGTTRLFASDTGRSIAGSDHAYSHAFSPDGELLLIGSDDVEIWNSASGARVRTLPSQLPNLIGFSRGGELLATRGADESISVWRTTPLPSTATTISGPLDPRAGLEVTADHTRLITAEHEVAHVWDAKTGALLVELHGHTGQINAIATPATGARPYVATASFDDSVRVWNVDTGTPLAVLDGHTDAVHMLAFSADGTLLASGGDDHSVRVWDPAAGVAIGTPMQHPEPVSALAVSSDGRLIASASKQLARVWEARSGAMLTDLDGLQDPLEALVFSPDGSRLATHDRFDRIQLWSTDAGELLWSLDDPGSLSTLAFSPDGARLASAAGLWDAHSGLLIAKLDDYDNADAAGSSARYHDVVFSPNGGLLAVGAWLWDAHTGARLGVFDAGHEQPVYATAFVDGGRRLATLSKGELVIRESRPPMVVACERLRSFAVAYAEVAATCDAL